MDLKALSEMPPWEWPEGAGDLFLEALRDSRLDESDRLIAAELAGDCVVVNDKLFRTLLGIVGGSEESERLRARAAIALGPAFEYAYMDGFDDPDDMPISEGVFIEAHESLRRIFFDAETPKEVRRRVLEASVRAPQDWHQDAICGAYGSTDDDWKLTAVFSMEYVRGFDEQILEALGSDNDDIQYQAVCAAGTWGLDAAWSLVSGIVTSECEDKALLLAAIEAVACIRPREAGVILVDLTQDEDEDIVEAAYEAMMMAEGPLAVEDSDEEDGDFLF